MRACTKIVVTLAAALCGMVAAHPAFSQSAKYPERPITIVVPYPPGTITNVSRLVGEVLRKRLGQPIVIDNKPGAFGNIGLTYAARQAPDGYTVGLIVNSMTLNPHLYKMEVDVLKDIIPVARAVDYYFVLVVSRNVPVASVKEFFDYAKSQKNLLHFGIASTASQLQVVNLTEVTGAKFEVVPYKGGPEVTRAVMAGEIAVMQSVIAEAVGRKDSPELKLLGVSAPRRVAQLPNIPAMAETIPGYQEVSSMGYAVPAGTSRAIVDLLNREITGAVNEEDVKAQLEKMGLDAVPRHGPEVYAKAWAEEYERNGRIVKKYQLKAMN